MIAHIERFKSHCAPIKHSPRNIPQTKLIPGFSERSSVYLYKHVVDPFNICVTTVNTRNVFYCKISECAHCLQQVQLLLTHSVLVVCATNDKLFARSL
jgi:hypothetical protein